MCMGTSCVWAPQVYVYSVHMDELRKAGSPTHTLLMRLAVAFLLLLTSIVFDVSTAPVSGAQDGAIPTCPQGMLTVDLSGCYVPAEGPPLEFAQSNQTFPVSAFGGSSCPVGFTPIEFEAAIISCLLQFLTVEQPPRTCPITTTQVGLICMYPGGPIPLPCTDSPTPGHTPPCVPAVSVYACEAGFVYRDASICLADELLVNQQFPTSSIEEYVGGSTCVAGFVGPDASGLCQRVVLTAVPDVPSCRTGTLVIYDDGLSCTSDATPVLVPCALEPAGLENGPCSAFDASLVAPEPARVSACPVGQPTPDQSRCFTYDVQTVVLPDATTRVACATGTILGIGGGNSVCLFDELPTPAGCDGLMATVDLSLGQVPTEGPDVIIGTEGDDVIAALGGDDVICGLGGNDRVWGGSGNDRIFGQDGDDTLRGGPGNDVLAGQDGVDNLAGGSGDDEVWGGEGDDAVVRGGTGDDFVDGGRGNDALVNGNGGLDRVVGGYGDDKVVGGPRPDEVSGGAGNDEVKGNKGADTLWGGFGNDAIFGGPQPDEMLGGVDVDSCSGGTTGGDPVAIENDVAIGCESVVSVP